jgi:hypothetical protein
MTTLRTFTIATSFVLAVAVAPSTSAANPLLSGYGGPGQGNQAILGSALLNGPDEGSGGPSGPASSGTETASSSGASGSSSGSGQGDPSRSRHASGKPAHASAPASGAYSSTRSLTPTADVGSQTLGLSGTDLLYLLLGCGALIMTAAITRMMVRRVP